MTRDVCGICWCPYDNNGRCGCASTPLVKDDTDLLRQALDALIWTTGSKDFDEGGVARDGALKCLFPAITALIKRLGEKGPRVPSDYSDSHHPLTDEQISILWHESGEQPFKFARMLLAQ